jgi:hypothetical protein
VIELAGGRLAHARTAPTDVRDALAGCPRAVVLPTMGRSERASRSARLSEVRDYSWIGTADAVTGVWRSLAARFVRDEEAAGSNPATPTEKFQLDAMIVKPGDHGIDRLLAIRWRDKSPTPSP